MISKPCFGSTSRKVDFVVYGLSILGSQRFCIAGYNNALAARMAALLGPLQRAEHRRLCGKSPKGRGDGSPRLRSSAWTHCLSNPAKPRSTGNLERRSAEGALPGCVSFGDFSL